MTRAATAEFRKLREALAHARWRAEALHVECVRAANGEPFTACPPPPPPGVLRSFLPKRGAK